jgi:hypothetical protein
VYSNVTNGITVRNGSFSRWTNYGLAVNGATVEDVAAHDNQNGIHVGVGSLTRCTAADNASVGIDTVLAVVSQCTASSNGIGIALITSILRDCATSSNSDRGINADISTVEGCASRYDRWGIVARNNSNVHHNIVSETGSDGIRLSGGPGQSIIADNSVRTAGMNGPASGIYVENNDNRISRNTVSGGSYNNAVGINVVGSYNTIDQNSTFENYYIGLVVVGSKNTVILNSSTGNVNPTASTNYSIGAGNNAAPVVDAASATNPLSNTQ